MDLGIKGKVAMVAAGSQGLGFAIAKALAAEGARVSIAARRRETISAAAAGIAEQTGAQVMSTVADVTSAGADGPVIKSRSSADTWGSKGGYNWGYSG